MANTTLATLRTNLRKRIGNPSSTDVTDADLTEIINYAHREIVNKFPFKVTRGETSFTTVAGTQSYDMPTDVFVTRKLYDYTNKRRLLQKGERYFSEHAFDDQGQPLYYVRIGSTLRLLPTPDDAYDIRHIYKAKTTDLAADGDTVLISQNWDEGILKLARVKYYTDLKPDIPKASFFLNEYKTWLMDQPTEVEEESDDIDMGVEVPTLAGTDDPRLDFDHEDC